MSDIVERLQRIADYWMPRDESARVEVPVRWIKEVLDEIERMRSEYEDEIDLKRAALNGTSKSMGAEIERLKALLLEVLDQCRETDKMLWDNQLYKRIRAALGDKK